MKQFISIALFLLLQLFHVASYGQGQVNQLFPCVDDTGITMPGCFAISLGNGRYIEAAKKAPSTCIGDDLVVEFVAVNTRFGVSQGDLVYTMLLENACTTTGTETITTLVVNLDGSVTYTSEDGSVTTIPAPVPSVMTQTVIAGNPIAVHSDGEGVNIPILETVTNAVYNPVSHEITYTGESGVPIVLNLDVGKLNYAAGTNILTYTAEDGTLTTLVLNDIGVANLIAGNLIATITDESGNTYSVRESITTLASSVNTVDPQNPVITLTYINEGGSNPVQNITIPIPPGTVSALTQIVTSGNQIATHNDGNGTLTPMFETVTGATYDPVAHQIVYTDESGGPTILELDVGLLAYDTLTNALTHTAEDGTITNLTLNNIAVANLIAGNRIATITDELGNSFDIDESITTLVGSIDVTDPQNPIVTFTYTNEDGSNAAQNITIPIPPETLTTAAYNGILHQITYTDEAGTPNLLDLNVGTLTHVETTHTLTYTAEDGIVTNIPLLTCDLAAIGAPAFYWQSVDTIFHVDYNCIIDTIFQLDFLTSYQEIVGPCTDTIRYTDEGGTVNEFLRPKTIAECSKINAVTKIINNVNSIFVYGDDSEDYLGATPTYIRVSFELINKDFGEVMDSYSTGCRDFLGTFDAADDAVLTNRFGISGALGDQLQILNNVSKNPNITEALAHPVNVCFEVRGECDQWSSKVCNTIPPFVRQALDNQGYASGNTVGFPYPCGIAPSTPVEYNIANINMAQASPEAGNDLQMMYTFGDNTTGAIYMNAADQLLQDPDTIILAQIKYIDGSVVNYNIDTHSSTGVANDWIGSAGNPNSLGSTLNTINVNWSWNTVSFADILTQTGTSGHYFSALITQFILEEESLERMIFVMKNGSANDGTTTCIDPRVVSRR